MKHQGNDTASPSDDPILPEVYTATVACIYDVDGKCKGILTPERLIILLRAFKKANNGLHDNIHLPLLSLAPLLVGLITRKILLPSNIQAKRLELISTDASPPHYHRPTKMGLVTKEKMASPLDHDPTLPQYWSEHLRDEAFKAHCNAFSSRFTGFSVYLPSHLP